MFTVPEVDDDAETTPPADPSKSLTQTEAPKESPPDPPTSIPSTEEKEDAPAEVQHESTSISPTDNESITAPASRQHISRLTHFHRNTIHGCDPINDRTTSHQQHHSAPPSQNQQSKTGLDAIHENGEYSAANDQQAQQNTTHPRFPRSSTVPYPAYATVRKTTSHYMPPTYYYCPEDGQFNGQQPFPIINSNFQPISPHHHYYQNTSRPVDILKPTFLIVPKATEQRLIAQLSASNSPVLTTNTKTKSTTKTSQKSPSTVHNVAPQTTAAAKNDSPTKGVMDIGHQHIGLLATPNPSPYVHFVHVPSSAQSPELPSQEGPPETTIMHEEFLNLNEYQQHQPSTSIRSMPNIALAQVSPHHLYGSPSLRHYYLAQQPTDEQQILTTTESTSGVRSATVPQMTRTTDGRIRNEIGEMDESSLASFDLAHTDVIDMPGSWRYQPVPIRTIARRYRQPIPQSFLESQQYVSDSEQILHSSSYRQSQLFGSIPTINRQFDSIRSLQPITFPPSIRLSDKDILKIAAFYKSMGTLVYVAHSTATLFTSDFDSMANLKDWKKLYTGVPIWLFNTGMNPKRARSIRLIISELGSSFTLWDTIVNGASDVRLPKSRHITLKSLETGAILALKFDDTNATDEFHQYFVKLSCDPRNADLFDVFNSKRRRPSFRLRMKKIRKSAISKPSHFNHITKVDEHDRDSLYTFSVLVDDAIVSSPPITTTTIPATPTNAVTAAAAVS